MNIDEFLKKNILSGKLHTFILSAIANNEEDLSFKCTIKRIVSVSIELKEMVFLSPEKIKKINKDETSLDAIFKIDNEYYLYKIKDDKIKPLKVFKYIIGDGTLNRFIEEYRYENQDLEINVFKNYETFIESISNRYLLLNFEDRVEIIEYLNTSGGIISYSPLYMVTIIYKEELKKLFSIDKNDIKEKLVDIIEDFKFLSDNK